MPPPASPFAAGRPMRPDEPIFGRDDAFAFIHDSLKRHESVNLIGERRMGKTSLLNHLAHHPQHRPPGAELLLAEVDLQANVTAAADFYGRALCGLLADPRAARLGLRNPAPPQADYATFETALRKLCAAGLRPLLLVDEFERLLEPQFAAGFPAPVFFDGLRALQTVNLLALVVASRLLRLRDIAKETASALESDSATNQLRRLAAARGGLKTLSTQPLGGFGPAVQQWTRLVDAGLDEARRRQQQDEPIPQIYHGDGRPVFVDGRADEDTPFKGRRALFRRLEEALGGADGERSTYLLVGQRRSGKTSALLQLERRLGTQVVPAFLDLQSEKLGGAEQATGLLHGIAGTVNDEARRRGVVLPDLTRRLLDAEPYPAFGRWLDAVETALGSRRLLLCLDEYEALEQGLAAGRFDERLLMALRHIVQHRRRVDVLLSGNRHIDELPPRWASALINTLSLPVSYLDEADARELVVRPVRGFPDIYRTDAVEQIIRLTHCQPYLVQLLCALLVERMNKARRMPPASWVEVADVQAVIGLALERGATYFSDLWRGQAGGDTAQALLEALAEADGLALDAAALRLVEPEPRRFNAALRGLIRREIVAKDGEVYRILVPLVGEYVRAQRG